ncbi:hypothetical protein JCM19236_262 [Vibrio sp. JCM 19236]|nr:hypothetical protein JCM19236_262 [Vibrio sp. JCM 19236]
MHWRWDGSVVLNQEHTMLAVVFGYRPIRQTVHISLGAKIGFDYHGFTW